MITGGGEEDAAWSIWAFTNEAGEMWTGELFIMRAAEEDRYLAWIQVEHQFDD